MRGEQLKFFSAGDDANQKNKRRLITIPLDTFILSSVVVALLFILAFSLGVERGRRAFYNNEEDKNFVGQAPKQEKALLSTQTKNILVLPSKEGSSQVAVKPIQQTKEVVARKEQSLEKNTEITQPAIDVGSYYIQIASYNKENFAQEEAKKLKDKGFPSYVTKKGNFVVLYVGTFKTKTEAEKNISLLKKNYKDCVLRVR